MDMKKALQAASKAAEKPPDEDYKCRGCGKSITWFGACDDCVTTFDETNMNRTDRVLALGVPKLLIGCRWDTFDLPKGQKHKHVVGRIKLLQRWLGEPQLAVLTGRPGTGKTHMAIATVWRRTDMKGPYDMRFIQERKLLEDLKRSFDDSANDFRHKLEKVRFLIIDDWGHARMTEFAVDTMYGLVTQRYDEGKVTLITTNLVSGDIEAIDPRLGSRLRQSLIVNTSSLPDRRKEEGSW